jgi:hypothetical protein
MFEIFLSQGVKIVLWGYFLLGLKSLTRDFRLQLFFMNRFPSVPYVPRWGHFEFLQKIAELLATSFLSSVSRCSPASLAKS